MAWESRFKKMIPDFPDTLCERMKLMKREVNEEGNEELRRRI
jgi:hypothetical protein